MMNVPTTHPLLAVAVLLAIAVGMRDRGTARDLTTGNELVVFGSEALSTISVGTENTCLGAACSK